MLITSDKLIAQNSSVMPTSIQPDLLEVMKARWYYFISTVLTPTQQK